MNRYGVIDIGLLVMINPAQILIFRARSWKKNMSLMNINPPPWATCQALANNSACKNFPRLLYCREESVEYSRSHEAIEGVCRRAPSGSGGGNDQEPEEDRKTTKVCGQGNND